MKRRTALTATTSVLAALTGLAGCLGTSESATTDETERTTDESPSPTTTVTPTERVSALSLGEAATLPDGRTLTVADPTVQVSTLWNNGAFSVIQREAGVQFLVVDVTGVEGGEVDPTSFALEADGEVLEPAGRFEQVIPTGVGRESTGTPVAIPVPVAAVSAASVAYAPNFAVQARWRLDDATTTALASRPDLLVQDAELVDSDGGIGVRVRVENRGDRRATLRGLIEPGWAYDISDPLGVTVPAGGTATETVPAPSLGLGGETPAAAALRFRTDPGPLTRRFVVESASTTTASS